MWPRPVARPNEADAQRFRARRAELGLGPLVIHANYLINLASPEPVLRARSILAFHGELVRALALGAEFLVVHPGSGRGGSQTQAVSTVAQSLKQAARGVAFGGVSAFRDLASGGLRILIENTAGQGSCVGSRFAELRDILEQAPQLPLGVCIDTAHAFAAGYGIHTAAGLEDTIAELEQSVGLGRVAVIHVNDSKAAFGSRVDRHANIGEGKIGLEAFTRILNHPRLTAALPDGLPGRGFILETPIDQPGDDRRNVRRLWEAVGAEAKQMPNIVDGFTMFRGVPKPSAQATAKARPTAKRHEPKTSVKKTTAKFVARRSR
jgi:deoxyribonuclease-4